MNDLHHPEPRVSHAIDFDARTPAPLADRGRRWLTQSGASASSWPMLHGDHARTGISIQVPDSSYRRNFKSSECLFDYSGRSRLLFASGNIVFVAYPGRLAAHSHHTGGVIWEFRNYNQLYDILLSQHILSVLVSEVSPTGRPANSQVVCSLYRLDPETGTQLSRTPITADWDQFHEWPNLTKSSVYLRSPDGCLEVLSAEDGTLRCRSQMRIEPYPTFLDQSHSLRSEVFLAYTNVRYLVAFDPSCTDPLWVSFYPTRLFDEIMVGNEYVAVVSIEDGVFVHELATGLVVFSLPHDLVSYPTLTHHASHLFILSDNHVYAVDICTWTVAWHHLFRGNDHYNPTVTMLTADHRVAVFGSLGSIHVLDVHTGNTIWTAHSTELYYSERAYLSEHQLVLCRRYYTTYYNLTSGSIDHYEHHAPFYISQIEYSDRSIYQKTASNRLICLDRETGLPRWDIAIARSISTSPSLYDDSIYVGFCCTDNDRVDDPPVESILVRYRSDQNDSTESSYVESDFVLDSHVTTDLAVFEDSVFFGTDSDRVFSYRMQRDFGETTYAHVREWAFDTIGAVYSTPAISKQGLFFGCDGGVFYAVDTESGREIWSIQKADSIRSSPALSADSVFVGGDDGTVSAYSVHTGDELWSFQTSEPVRSSPAVASGAVYFGGLDGKLYALDELTGAKLWEFVTAGPIYSSPVAHEGVVYIGSDDMRVYAVDARSGIELWSRMTGGAVRSSPAVGAGAVCVGSDDGCIYMLRAATGWGLQQFVTSGPVPFSPLFHDGVFYCSILNGEVRRFSELPEFSDLSP